MRITEEFRIEFGRCKVLTIQGIYKKGKIEVLATHAPLGRFIEE
jgi:hypothetical protein